MAQLLSRICTPDAFATAWRRVSGKASAGGYDCVSVDAFEVNAETELRRLREEVLGGRYVPQPQKEVRIPKGRPGAGDRTLRLPSVRDKIVQQVIRAGIEPRLERTFLDVSYGYRPGKGPTRAARRVTHEIVAGKAPWAATADIQDFFGSIDQDLLVNLLRSHFPDEDLLRLIRLWLRMGAVDHRSRWQEITEGVGQGGVISPLLSNLYLHGFDEHLSGRFRLVRYADDFVLLGPDRLVVREALEAATAYLEDKLHLRLNPHPAAITSPEEGFVFLGLHFRGKERELGPGREQAVAKRIAESAVPSRGSEAAIKSFNQMVTGWRTYYGALLSGSAIEILDRRIIEALGDLGRSLRTRRALKGGRKEWTSFFDGAEFLTPRSGQERKALVGALVARTLEREATPSRPGAGVRPHSPPVERVVRASRRRHLASHAIASDLIITTPGLSIGKGGERLFVRHQGKTIIQLPIGNLTSLTVATHGVSLSSDVVGLCARRGIPILFVDGIDVVEAIVVAPAAPRSDLLISQVRAAADEWNRLPLACAFAIGKIRNQMALMKYVGKYRRRTTPSFGPALDRALLETRGIVQQIGQLATGRDGCEGRVNRIFGLEGRAAQWYWELFGAAVGGVHGFEGRRGRGARDPVNMLLNYGYAVLRSRVNLAVMRAGLAPEIGFLHACGERRAALVFDLMEEFRAPVVDRSVLALLGRNQIATGGEEGSLGPASRGSLVRAIRGRLGTLQRYGDGHRTLDEIIIAQARRVADHVSKGSLYRPYRAPW